MQEESLAAGRPTQLFTDEYRCPVYVQDIVRSVEALIGMQQRGRAPPQRLLNMGGPQRLSRAQFGQQVRASHPCCLP